MTRSISALLLAVLLLTACGQPTGSGQPGAEGTPSTPAATSAASEQASADPTEDGPRIVSLSPTATEILFAIGAGDLVVAVDDQSTYPPEAPRTKLSGYEPNLEAIASYSPELVVTGYAPEELVPGLRKLGVEVLQQNAAVTLDDTYAQITELGERTGHEAEAAALVDGMQAEIKEIAATVPHRQRRPTYYHELDNTLYTVTSKTFVGSLYELAGLRNVADRADKKGKAGGYPQLSREYLIEADPDFVFLADTKCCGQNEKTFAKRPGFAQLTAVKRGTVIGVDDDIASRWGPRVVDFLRIIVDATRDAR